VRSREDTRAGTIISGGDLKFEHRSSL
jgi:hypothetical protein